MRAKENEMNQKDADRLAREVFALFAEHVSIPPQLEATLLASASKVIAGPQPEWCRNCPFAKHVHYAVEGKMVAPGCSGYEPAS